MAKELVIRPHERPPIREPGELCALAIPTECYFVWHDWRRSLTPLNLFLEAVGIDPLKYGKNVFELSFLDGEPDEFEPLRAYFNPLGEDYSDMDQAAAAFGIHVLYWRAVHNGLTGLDCRPSQALGFRLVPVFQFQSQEHLIVSYSAKKPGIYGINYLGDNDAIDRAQRRVFKMGKRGEMTGTEMGLDDEFFTAYLKRREEIDAVETTSGKVAMQRYIASEAFQRVQYYAPQFDQIRDALVSAKRHQILPSVQSALINPGMRPSSELYLAGQISETISIYIETGFDLAYDDCLRESGYMEAIGRLRELMNAYYPKVIAAMERGAG